MSYEELVESRKNIGDMTKEELFTYCGGLLSEVWDYEKENEQLNDKVEELMELYTTERHCKDDYKSIIKEVREYITYARTPRTIYESGYGKGTCVEICMEHLLEILDKVDKGE